MREARILFVNHTAQLGGGEFVLRDVARHYRHRCHVALLADGPLRALLTAAGVSASVIPATGAMLDVRRQGRALSIFKAVPATMAAAWRLMQIARDYDILYPNSQKAAIVAMLAGWLLNRPVVWHLHDILSASHFGVVQRRIVVTLANIVALRIIANSAATRDAFAACGGSAVKVTIIPNGIDVAPFLAVSDHAAADLRHQLGVTNDRLVGVFGRLAPWKGQHLLIRALAQLPNVHALVVGDALFGENTYRQFLLDEARLLHVTERVHMLGFRADLPKLMRAVDIVVHTSTAPEPFGRVIVEGMLARRPVVAADGGAAREILGTVCTQIIPPNDHSALADIIGKLFAVKPERVLTLTTRNFARARSLFSMERMLADIDRVLQGVV